MTSDIFYKSIENQLKKETPFVVYKKPNGKEIKALLQKDSEVYVAKDLSESGFVFAPFDDREETILIPFHNSEFIESHITSNEINFSEKTFEVLEDDKQQHVHLVEKGIEAIKNKELLKVVLSRCESISLSEVDLLQIFKYLLNKYPTAFVYCWYHPKVGLWLGATPETLLQVKGNRFETMSLAGTQKYNGTLDVSWTNKEKEEQQIVTNSILKSLKQKSDTIAVSNANTVRAGDLLHLQTIISGTFSKKIKDTNLQSLLNGLHPTPAVCGFPKDAARQFILENENYNREFYTGFLGELNLKENQTRNRNKRNVENNAYQTIKIVSNLFVNLRCMQLKNKEALVYVGGGIVKDSIPENEWTETVNKTKTIKAVLD